MFVGTLTAGAVGGILGPIALLNFQGGAYVVAGGFVLLMPTPSRAPRPCPGWRLRAELGRPRMRVGPLNSKMGRST
jgi:hypothetical protein